MSTLALIVVATLVYALFGIFNSQAGGRIDASLSSFIFNGLGALIPLAVFAGQRFASSSGQVTTRLSGVVYSVLAGVAIAAFSIILIKIYGRGGELSYVFPTIYGGAIALTALVGWAVLGDTVSVARVVGVAAIVAGTALLAA